MKKVFVSIWIVVLFFTLFPHPTRADGESTLYLPGVQVNGWSVTVNPPPGQYPMNYLGNGEMSIKVVRPGCHSAWIKSMELDSDRTYFVYHGECVNGVASMLVSFYGPVKVNNLVVGVMDYDWNKYSKPIDGEWSFGE